MSVLQEAFKLVRGGGQRPDVERFIRYVDDLTHESIPGDLLYLNFRGVSTNTALLRILGHMLEIAKSAGGTHAVTLKGLAQQLAYFYAWHRQPAWGTDDAETASMCITTDAWRLNLVRTMIQARRMHSDAVVEITFKGNLDYDEVIRTIALLDSDYSPCCILDATTEEKLQDYFDSVMWARVRVKVID